jgi:hypothetical protein
MANGTNEQGANASCRNSEAMVAHRDIRTNGVHYYAICQFVLSSSIACMMSALPLVGCHWETAKPTSSTGQYGSAKPAHSADDKTKFDASQNAAGTRDAGLATTVDRNEGGAPAEVKKTNDIEETLRKTEVQVYPTDPALTAMILAKYLDCKLLKLDLEARKKRKIAEDKHREAVSKQKVADDKQKEAKIADQIAESSKHSVEQAGKDLIASYKPKLVKRRNPNALRRALIQESDVKITRVAPAILPMHERADIRVIPPSIYGGPEYIEVEEPPERRLPETKIVHPFNLEETRSAFSASAWDALLDAAWPRGCDSSASSDTKGDRPNGR